MNYERRSALVLGAIVCLAVLAALPTVCAAAAIHQHFVDPDRFPALDQHDVCKLPDPNFGCGPTAAITSLAYFGREALIPRAQPPRPFYEDMVAAAHAIAGQPYMGTTAAGTTVSQFIPGMDKYLSDKLAGVAAHAMAAQMGAAWPADPHRPKPPFVQDGLPPAWQFLLSKLEQGWTVQLALDGKKPDGTRGGHWLTLTGFYFADFDFDDVIDQGQDIAFIRFVDPWSGRTGQADIWLRPASNILGTNYVGVAHGAVGELKFDDVRLIAAVAELVHEPGSLALVAIALLACAVLATSARQAHPAGA